MIEQYTILSSEGASDTASLQKLEHLQSQIDALGGWQPSNSPKHHHPTGAAEFCANGRPFWRLAPPGGVGCALVSKPDLLLLDEPTNHLDIATIEWLEHEIRGYSGSVVFITHDRAFLQKLATRIVEIDRGRVISWPGDYENYLKLKEQALEEEATHNALFDNA